MGKKTDGREKKNENRRNDMRGIKQRRKNGRDICRNGRMGGDKARGKKMEY